MAFRGIIFDIDNVFFDGSYWHRLLHQMICGLGLREQFQTFREQWQTSYLPKVYQGELKYWDALASFFCHLGLSQSEARELLASSQAKLKHAQENLRPLASVVETLSELQRQGIRLGIVCNSIHQSHALIGILADINIRQPFDSILTSRSLGRVLPDEVSLGQATREMLLNVNEVAYLSTRPQRLQIAAAAGYRAIWLVDRQGAAGTISESAPVDSWMVIHRIGDVIPLAARLESSGAIN